LWRELATKERAKNQYLERHLKIDLKTSVHDDREDRYLPGNKRQLAARQQKGSGIMPHTL
ncbi:MAG: hypothetical protein KJ945_01595, partial [Gammaproteobacteria bacterium]|nr:hypothetical protein [Gammaproteobacteria bacterium]